MKTSRVFVLFFVCALGWTAYPKGTAKFVRVTLDEDAAHTVRITWNTDSPNRPSYVEYGETTAYGHMAKGSVFMGNGDLKAIHEVILTGLKPDTLYHYRVGGAGDWSEDYTFRTPPEDVCTPYTFVALGDDRSDNNYGPSNKWHPILEEAVEKDPITGRPPLFVLNTGDIVKKGSDVGQWLHFLKESSPLIALYPLMPALGNHDTGPGQGDSANYNQVFSLPRNDVSKTEDFYYFTFSNVIVAVLSTETYKDGDPKFSMQAQWLDRVLTEHPKMWKFVVFHKPCYTASKTVLGQHIGHPPNEEGQNKAFTEVFDKHHVDIVFNGHNHWYQRIGPLKGNGDSGQGIPVDDPSKGTIYIITGGAGAMTYIGIAGLNAFCATAKGSKVCSDKHHFVRLTINYNHLHVEVWATKQQTLNYSDSNRQLIDKFDIVKEVPDEENPCISQVPEGSESGEETQKPETTEEAVTTEEVEQQQEPTPDLPQEIQEEAGPELGEELLGESIDEASYSEEISVAEGGDQKEAVSHEVVDTTSTSSDTKQHSTPSGGCSQGMRGTPLPFMLLTLLLIALVGLRRKNPG